MEAYTAHVLKDTSFMTEFKQGTDHYMQVIYYNCGKNRKNKTPVAAQWTWRSDFSSRPFPAPKFDN